MRKRLWSVLLAFSLGISGLSSAIPSVAAPAAEQAEQEEMAPPYLYYPFDETEGEVAVNYGAGGEQWNAVKGGGALQWEDGLIGGAARLSDNGYFKIPDGVVEHTEDFTLSTWIYLDAQIMNQTICTFAIGTDQYLILTSQRGNAENGVSLVMTNGSDNPDKDNREQRISNTNQKEKLSAGAWHQLTFTLEGSVGNLYVDGELVQTKEDFTTNPSRLGHTVDNYIGKPTWPDPHLKGMVDEFRLYNYALTQEQVHQISAQADEVLAREDAAKLDLGDLSQVMKDLKLPERGASGSKITWSSDDPAHLSAEGVIRRPSAGEGEAKVNLKADLEKGNAKAQRIFEVTIPDMSLLKQDVDIFAMGNGNPTVPAYLADASFYYDENTDMFYAYGTNDGAGGNNVFPTQVWYSKDCKKWENQDVEFPAAWIDEMGTNAIWAPSITYNPDTGK